MIDHTKGLTADIFEDINGVTLDNKIEDLIKQEQMKSEIRAENVVFKPALSWKGEQATQTVEGYNTLKYNAKGTFSLLFTRRNILVDVDTNEFKSFKEYFSCVLKDPLWIFQDSRDQKSLYQSPIASLIHYIECSQELVRNILEKDEVNSNKENGSEKGSNAKTKRELEKMNLNQKKLLKNYTKNVVATVYMCDNFPLTLEYLMPVLKILSNVSPHINRLKSFLERQSTINKNSFPLKASIPIFFSINAMITMKNFKFTPPDRDLFDFDKILSLKTVPTTKRIDPAFKEEKQKTEIGSDDEQAMKCWEDLVKNSSEDFYPDSPSKSEHQESSFVRRYTNGEVDESLDTTNQITQSFAKKNKADIKNRDLVDVYGEGMYDEDAENLEDRDISEKFNYETLKLKSHQTNLPKMITSIQQRFKPQENYEPDTPSNPMYIAEDHRVINNIRSLRARNSYKFLDTLNSSEALDTPKSSSDDKKEIKTLSMGKVSESVADDSHMKKMLRYALRNEEAVGKEKAERRLQLPAERKSANVIKAPVEGLQIKQHVDSDKADGNRMKSVDTKSLKKSSSFKLFKGLWKDH